jgi:peptidyl-prolyl cis-trans isomerase D
MISGLRKVSTSWVVVGLLGLVMLAFIITGVGTGGRGGAGQMGFGPEHVVTVGSESISVPDFNERMTQELNQARQQDPELDMPRFVASGAFDDILTQLINATVLTVFATDNGLAASKRMIDGVIAGVPGFQNAAGKFDETQFRSALANAKFTEEQLRRDIRNQLIQRQLLLPVGASPKVPDALARAYGALLLEGRAGTVGIVPIQAVGAGTEPTAAETAAYFKKNQARYTIPERRVLRYAVFGPAQVAAAAKASEAEIAAAYKSRAADFAAKETRTLSQVVLPDQAAANAFAAKLKAGKSFAQVAAESGFSPADTTLGAQTKTAIARLSAPAVADAAFAAAKGGVTAPVRSPLGWHILRVEAITTIAARPLESVRSELVAAIEKQKSEDALAALATRIEDAISNGGTFDEVAKANALQVQETAPVTAAGAAPETAGYELPDEVRPLLKSGFDLAPDDDPVVETIVNGQRFALLAVGGTVAAAPPPLAQIAARVRGDLLRERAAARAKAVAQQIADRANAGMPLREAFAKAGVALPGLQPVQARRIDISQRNTEVPLPLQMLFSLPAGKTRVMEAPNGAGWFIVRLDTIVPGDVAKAPGIVEATRGQFAQVIGEEYAEQFAHAAARETEIDRNQGTIDKIRRDLQRSGGGE